ncbi:unnamed protein product [Mucor fragilis]
MVFPHEQSAFVDWLQCDVDGSFLFTNQLEQGYRNVAEEVGLFHANNEEYMANIWSDNQGLGVAINYADHVGEVYDEYMIFYEDMVCDQLLNELETTIFPGPGCMEEWGRVLGHPVEPVSTDAVMQSTAQMLDFSSTIDYSAYCVSEIVSYIEQATRHEQPPVDIDVLFSELEWIAAVQDTHIGTGGSAFNGDLQSSLLDDNEDVWADDYDDSWLFYGSDDDMHVFKSGLFIWSLRVRMIKKVPNNESSKNSLNRGSW